MGSKTLCYNSKKEKNMSLESFKVEATKIFMRANSDVLYEHKITINTEKYRDSVVAMFAGTETRFRYFEDTLVAITLTLDPREGEQDYKEIMTSSFDGTKRELYKEYVTIMVLLTYFMQQEQQRSTDDISSTRRKFAKLFRRYR